MVKRNKYHIQLKRTDLFLDPSLNTNPPDNTLQNYGLVFGEPVYLNKEKTLIIGPKVVGKTNIPNCNGVKLVSQDIEDPDDNSKTVNLVEQGVHFKNRDVENKVNLTDNAANTLYPITTMSAVTSDGTYELSEYLIHKLNIDETSIVSYPSLGVDASGVYVDEFDPVVPQVVSINQTLADIVNSKVSIDDESSAVTQDLALGVDLVGVYVRIPDGSVEENNFIKAYIDSLVDNTLGTRLLALEGNIYYLQEMLNNLNFVHVGSTPPTENNKLWIDTTTLTGGLKYCSNKITNIWSHVPVAYT